jgi:hypothetical protein
LRERELRERVGHLLHTQQRADNLGRHPKEGRGQPAVGLVAERTLRLRTTS